MNRLIAIDPGSKKCGLLLVDSDEGIVIDALVADHSVVIVVIRSWTSQDKIDRIILGNGTSSKYWFEKLKGFASIQLVEEKGTTLRSRERYWELWPPKSCLRWFPRGLLVPAKHLDAVAALVLLEDHLNKKLKWQGPKNFKILL